MGACPIWPMTFGGDLSWAWLSLIRDWIKNRVWGRRGDVTHSLASRYAAQEYSPPFHGG